MFYKYYPHPHPLHFSHQKLSTTAYLLCSRTLGLCSWLSHRPLKSSMFKTEPIIYSPNPMPTSPPLLCLIRIIGTIFHHFWAKIWEWCGILSQSTTPEVTRYLSIYLHRCKYLSLCNSYHVYLSIGSIYLTTIYLFTYVSIFLLLKFKSVPSSPSPPPLPLPGFGSFFGLSYWIQPLALPLPGHSTITEWFFLKVHPFCLNSLYGSWMPSG